MKKTLIALATMAATGFGMSALAEEATGPTMLTDAQMDQVVAGVNTDYYQLSVFNLGTVGCVVAQPAGGGFRGSSEGGGFSGRDADIAAVC